VLTLLAKNGAPLAQTQKPQSLLSLCSLGAGPEPLSGLPGLPCAQGYQPPQRTPASSGTEAAFQPPRSHMMALTQRLHRRSSAPTRVHCFTVIASPLFPALRSGLGALRVTWGPTPWVASGEPPGPSPLTGGSRR